MSRRALAQEAINDWVTSNVDGAHQMVVSLRRWILHEPYGGLWFNNGHPVTCLPFPLAVGEVQENFLRRYAAASNMAMVGELRRLVEKLDPVQLRSFGLSDFQISLIAGYVDLRRHLGLDPVAGAPSARLDFFLDILQMSGWECEENRRTGGGVGYQTASSRWLMTTPLWKFLQLEGFKPRVYVPWPSRIHRLYDSYEDWCRQKGIEDEKPTLFVFGPPDFRGEFANEEQHMLVRDFRLFPRDYPPIRQVIVADQPREFRWDGRRLRYGDMNVRFVIRTEKWERAAARGDSQAVVEALLSGAIFMDTDPLAELADLKIIQARWWMGGPQYLMELGLSASEAAFLHGLLPRAEVLDGEPIIADTCDHPELWVVKEFDSAGGGGDHIGPKFVKEFQVELWTSAVCQAAAEGAIRQQSRRIPVFPLMVPIGGRFNIHHVRYGMDVHTGMTVGGDTVLESLMSRAKVWDPDDPVPDTINVGAKGEGQVPAGFLITVRVD